MSVMSSSPTPRSRFSSALRDGLFAALITFGLLILLVGLKVAPDINYKLELKFRPIALAALVAIAFAGRFAMSFWIQPIMAERKAARVAKKAEKSGEISWFQANFGESSWFRDNFTKIVIAFLLIYPPLVLILVGVQGSLTWVDNFGVQILIYVMLAWGLNIVVGLAGLLDLGYVAFYAVGAYSYALISHYYGLSFWILLPIAGILASFWGVILGFPVLRLRGDYLAIVTLAFGEIIRLVLVNWKQLTNGSAGIAQIAKASFFGIYQFDVSKTGFAAHFGLAPSSAYYKIFLYYLILSLALLTAFVTIRLRRLPIGRAWEALREDEIACRSLGINTTTTKLTAFAIGAGFGGLAGAFFSARQGYVSPESFQFLESAIILAIVVLGGMGSLIGIAIAAVAMVGGTELLRQLEFLKSPYLFGKDFTPELYRMLIFGLAMVVVMLYKPRGFVGTREPTAFLHADHRAVSGEFSKEGHG
jgi:branched-chain amino acid transport system permease protein